MTMREGPTTKRCQKCGQPFVPMAPHHIFCSNCQQSRLAPEGGAAQRPPERTERRDAPGPAPAGGGLPADYLRSGYFDEKGNLWPALVLDVASDIAARLGADRSLSANQLRKFFNKVRLIESRLDASEDFGAVATEIASLSPLAAYAVGRQVASEVFKQFVDRNVALAMRDKESFRNGFLRHFEAVICYFKYRYPRQ